MPRGRRSPKTQGRSARDGESVINETQRKPAWLKIRPPSGARYNHIKGLRKGLSLATVCEEARCPNLSECWGAGTATFMILGDTCTRACRFCNVNTGHPHGRVDAEEPAKLASAVTTMELGYVVLTMVDRDDLPDGGADHAARCVEALRRADPSLKVEMLAGDFRGRRESIARVAGSGCEVFAHNLECVRRLTPSVRDRRCGYDQSLEVLKAARELAPQVVTKSSLMLGLGESSSEIREAMEDLRAADVQILTLGQYLRPAPRFLPVDRYVTPEEFNHWKDVAQELGFDFCASGPLVRSSYRAGEVFLEGFLKARARATGGGEGS